MLHAIVGKLITHYLLFRDNQPKLHDNLPQAEAKALRDLVVGNWILNKQCWAELEHYKRTQSILGKHPMFEIMRLKDGISALSTPNLVKKMNALNANISRNKQKGNLELVERDETLLEHAKQVAEKR